MQTLKPRFSPLRLTRLHRWAMLWLTWFAAFLDGVAAHGRMSRDIEAAAHLLLDRAERLLVSLAIIEAAPRVRTIAPLKHSPRARKRRGWRRALLGSRLRRRLRPRALKARIEALRIALATLVGQILRRLPRGFTRRRPFSTSEALTTCAGAALLQLSQDAALLGGLAAPASDTS